MRSIPGAWRARVNQILQAVANDQGVSPAFAEAIGTMLMTDGELFDAVHAAARKVSHYEAAEGNYSAENALRNAAKARLRTLRAEADSRGLGISFSAGQYLTAP